MPTRQKEPRRPGSGDAPAQPEGALDALTRTEPAPLTCTTFGQPQHLYDFTSSSWDGYAGRGRVRRSVVTIEGDYGHFEPAKLLGRWSRSLDLKFKAAATKLKTEKRPVT